jgi:hypothetical protein
VLGKVEVTDRRQVREILTAVRQAIQKAPKHGAACFWPLSPGPDGQRERDG